MKVQTKLSLIEFTKPPTRPRDAILRVKARPNYPLSRCQGSLRNLQNCHPFICGFRIQSSPCSFIFSGSRLFNSLNGGKRRGANSQLQQGTLRTSAHHQGLCGMGKRPRSCLDPTIQPGSNERFSTGFPWLMLLFVSFRRRKPVGRPEREGPSNCSVANSLGVV